MYLGVIADDFTGGTDIAGFLVQNGLSVTQYIGVPEADCEEGGPDAAIISLKSRSCPVEEAIADSLAALEWLLAQGCKQIFFKYCSTFDSTAKGNIGPVTDALLKALDSDVTVMCPALPVNGRTVYKGYLFVGDVLLNESGMRHHPVTPMLDANLMRLTEMQSKGRAANIPVTTMDQGAAAIRAAIEQLVKEGFTYVVPDSLTNQNLIDLGEALIDMPLVTGGSGLGMGLARAIVAKHGLKAEASMEAGSPPGGKCIILAGSTSVMTNAQVERYIGKAVSKKVDVGRCIEDAAGYAGEVADWLTLHEKDDNRLAPLVYATTNVEDLQGIQKNYGAEASGAAVEHFFSTLAKLLELANYDHFIVAGGETSGAVVKSLGVAAFHIGPQIAPGVPWVRAVDKPISLALKSGNFGTEDFFLAAQEFFL
ncbi:3-oxo-tetronate kinase [uncultured Cohaesibacter sp.]|uniref:3-oxo-tetronate kinase n=1 Tax=uncultured Cohaesibacter sp. TaxID=1002546 RepID=UPI0029C7F2DE|nr:3-oxo-tetronate kinase [uncultured Cohaesibacter sp.]